MPASIHGAGTAQPNLAFQLIVRSVQLSAAAPKPSTAQGGSGSPSTSLAEPSQLHHVDVKA